MVQHILVAKTLSSIILVAKPLPSPPALSHSCGQANENACSYSNTLVHYFEIKGKYSVS